MGGWGVVCKVIFMSNPTVVLRLGWGFDNNTERPRSLCRSAMLCQKGCKIITIICDSADHILFLVAAPSLPVNRNIE